MYWFDYFEMMRNLNFEIFIHVYLQIHNGPDLIIFWHKTNNSCKTQFFDTHWKELVFWQQANINAKHIFWYTLWKEYKKPPCAEFGPLTAFCPPCSKCFHGRRRICSTEHCLCRHRHPYPNGFSFSMRQGNLQRCSIAVDHLKVNSC